MFLKEYKAGPTETVLIRDFLRQQLGFVVIKTPTTADQLEWDLQQVYSRTERLALERAYWRVMKDGDPL